ncbi:Tyrosinase [Dactylella cylindrospora]|nr:Tyrosinase [Dactylella cylindrospora]
MDRLMAMYQAANPDTYVEPMRSIPTFANPSSPLDTVDTPLYPFRHPDNSFWTPRNISSVSSIFPLSYGYPEVPCIMSSANFDALRNHTTTEINRLYGPKPTLPTKRAIPSHETRIEWQAKVVIDQRELPGSFVIYIFLGSPPTDYENWSTAPSMIGTLTHLGTPASRMVSHIIGNNVVLTNTIIEALGGTPTKEKVLNYLQQNLNWTVVSDGMPVDVPKLHTLKISCISTEIKLPACANQLPRKGKDSYYLEVTREKAGGAASQCDILNPFQVDGSRMRLPQHISLSG